MANGGMSPGFAAETALPGEVLASLREIERRTLGLEAGARAAEDVAHEFGLLLDQTIVALVSLDGGGREAEPSIDALLQEQLEGSFATASLPPGLSDLCFPAVFELKRVRIELTAARSNDELIAASERARRKLRRALGFVLAALGNGRSAPPSGRDRRTASHLAEVDSALAVRRLYANFRRRLRRPDAETSEAVLGALRYAAGALAILVSSPEYGDVRASDRALLRHLRERILAWGKREQSLEVGLHLLDDLWTTADLLRDINRRQELRAHDRGLIEALLAEPPPHAAAWFDSIAALMGLDDALDLLLDRTRNEPLAALVPSVLERLRLLA